MKERTKEIVKDGFGSLVSNAAALRGAKNGPLWLTILMFIFGIIIPLIPLFVSYITTNGSSFLNKYSYGLERYVTNIAMDLNDTKEVNFSISEDHELFITNKDGSPVNFSSYGSEKPYIGYENKNTNQYDFLVYLSDATTNNAKNNLNNTIKNIKYDLGTKTVATEGSESVYHPSYMILFKNGVYVCIFGSNTSTAVAESYSGDFKTIKANDNCLATLLSVKNKDGDEIAHNMFNSEYVDGVYKNFKKFIDRSYDTLKVQNTLGTTGIFAGIFFGVNVLMGFIMWLLTRGKNNPNNYFTPWLTMKTQARLALAPAILTGIAGIFLINMLPVIYITTIGLRVMWISMKELRPVQG